MFLLKNGGGRRQSLAVSRLCAPPLPPYTENTQDARSNTALSKAAPAATQGHTPSRPHATNIPTQGQADLPALPKGDAAWGDPLAHTQPPREGAAHSWDSHALQITLSALPTSHMDFTNATHGPGCHIPLGPRAARTDYQHTLVSPYPQELWSGISHRS